MDTDTLIIICLLGTALIWLFTIVITEKRQSIKQLNKNERDRQCRAERVKQLTNKL